MPVLRGRGCRRNPVWVAALGIALIFAAGGFEAALAASSEDPVPSPPSSTSATSTTPAPSTTETTAAPTPAPDPPPLPSPDPAPPSTVTKRVTSGTGPDRTTVRAKAVSVKASVKGATATRPVLRRSASKPAPAHRAPDVIRPKPRHATRVGRPEHRRVHAPVASSSRRRLLQPRAHATAKRHQDPPARARQTKGILQLSPTAAAAVAADAGGSSSDGLIEFALIAFGVVVLLLALTPALVPSHLAKAVEQRHLDIALVGLAIVAVGLMLLAIGR
jgi:hypothetical protein